MASIYDVAKKANVSKSTVSRVLNNLPGVMDDKKARILSAIKELNYHPNGSARALALKQSKIIGVVVLATLGNFYGSFIDGIYQEAYINGYSVLFCINNITKESENGVHYTSFLLDKVDGIIFLGHAATREEIIRLRDQNLPIVLIYNYYKIPGVPSINVNNFDGAYNAVRYLIQLGHKKIAHLKGGKDAYSASDRFKGYVQALEDYNLEYDPDLVIEGNYSFPEAYVSSIKLLQRRSDFTAIFCSNDEMAGGFIKSAIEHGFCIPDDFSVVGFDDINLVLPYQNLSRGLTTIKQPRYEMGQLAVKALIGKIENDVNSPNINLDLEMIIRDSVKTNNR